MATTDYTKPDFQSMYDKIGQAWNTALTRADENRRRYITDLGYEGNVPSYTSQAAQIATGKAPVSADVGSFKWTKNPYSAVQGLMRNGGNEKQSIRNSFTNRGLSGGIVNQATNQIDFATGGERLKFGQNMLDNFQNMDSGILDASSQYNNSRNDVATAQANWQLDQDYLQNAKPPDPAVTPTTPPVTTPGTPAGTVQADKLIASLRKRNNPGKNLNAIYAYIRKNKGKIDKTDLAVLQKMAAQYRVSRGGGTVGTKSPNTNGRMGGW